MIYYKDELLFFSKNWIISQGVMQLSLFELSEAWDLIRL